MPKLDLTDAELAAVAAAIGRSIEQDRLPHARASTGCTGPSAKLEPKKPPARDGERARRQS